MSIRDDVENLKKRVEADELKSFEFADKKVKSKKVPFKFRARRHFKDGKLLVVFLGYNHNMDFRWGVIEGGLIKVLVRGEVKSYNSYEEGAVYFHKKYPVAVIFEWRISPVGGKAEEFVSRSVGGDADKKLAIDLGLSSAAQQTIIRAVKAEEINKDDGKKKKKLPIAVIILVIGLLLFVLGKAFGVI